MVVWSALLACLLALEAAVPLRAVDICRLPRAAAVQNSGTAQLVTLAHRPPAAKPAICSRRACRHALQRGSELPVLKYAALASIVGCAGGTQLVATRASCAHVGGGAVRTRLAGVNIYDALWDANGPDANLSATLRTLREYQGTGLELFRFFGFLWGPAHAFWYTNPHEFWERYDRVMDAIDSMGFSTIPSIGIGQWSMVSNKLFPGLNESIQAEVVNTSSVARQLARRYYTELVTRYRNRTSVLLWELGNELNLEVNMLGCPGSGRGAWHNQCFNTSQMVEYTTELVSIIRAADPVRPITSGYSAPRPSAWHNEHSNFTGAEYPFWSIDNVEQYTEILLEQNQAVDIISLHLYGLGSYLNSTNLRTTAPLRAAARAAAGAGKLIYLGEYGNGTNDQYRNASDRAYALSLLDLQVAMAEEEPDSVFALSTYWSWDCPSHPQDEWVGSDGKEYGDCLTPGRKDGSDAMINAIKAANAKLDPTRHQYTLP